MRMMIHDVSKVRIGNRVKNATDTGSEFWCRHIFIASEDGDIDLMLFADTDSELGIMEDNNGQ